MACSQPQATAPSVDVSQINPVLSTDPYSILFDPLRAEMSRSFPQGTDLGPGYASLDRRFRPALTDAGPSLLKAVDQYRAGHGPSGQVTPSPVAEQRTDVVLLASVAPPVEIVNKRFDQGQQDVGDGWTNDLTGGLQLTGAVTGVTLHLDSAGDSTKSLAPQDFVVIDETMVADVKVDTCPDAAGLIHGTLRLNLSERVQVSSPTKGRSQGERHYLVTGDIVGHVNDAAELTAFDLLHMTTQRVGTEVGAAGAGAFLAVGYSFTGIDPNVLPGHTTGHLGADSSARVHATNMDMADVSKEVSAMIAVAWIYAGPVVFAAEKGWRSGICVELVATKGPDPKRLGPGQTSKFTIEVHHKPDGERLDKPVVATPHGGKVDPGGRPVAPPADFSFTADGGKAQAYKVDLKSTSRRGIGELGLDFGQGYKLTITFVAGPSARGMPNTVPSIVTGTVSADPSGPSLSGPGVFHGEGYTGDCTYDSGNVHTGWTDAGPVVVPVTLKAIDKGDGNMELTIDTQGLRPLPPGTFPVGGGTVTHELTYTDCGPRSGTETIKAEPPSG